MIGRRYRRQDLSAEHAGDIDPHGRHGGHRGGRNRHHRTLCFAKGAGQAPYCVTVDFESVGDKKVTVRDSDTMKQERVGTQELLTYLKKNFIE